MKNTFLLLSLLALLLASACTKQECLDPDPYDATRIEGTWAGLVPAQPDWTYHFSQGTLTLTQPEEVIATPYSISDDTIFFHPGAAYWVVRFRCDSLVECHTHGSGIISPRLFLERI